MKRHLIVLTFLTLLNTAYGQTVEEAYALLGRWQLDSSLAAANNILKRDSSIPQAYDIAGRSLYRKGDFKMAIPFLEKVNTFTNAPPSTRAWAMHDLALSFYYFGEYEKARQNLLTSLELNATKNVTKEALSNLHKLGFDKLYDSWTIKESAHFIFHFQDTSAVGNISLFINRKEKAFNTINDFFKAKLPKKIDYFVWKEASQAKAIFKVPFPFSEPFLCLTHTLPQNTVGHEMTHSISFFATKLIKKTQLISEGTCVHFDLTNRDNMVRLKRVSQQAYSVIDIWKGASPGEDIVYPLGGELVKRLIETFGRDKFIQLLADQSYTNAKKIYGEKLDALISELEKDIRN